MTDWNSVLTEQIDNGLFEPQSERDLKTSLSQGIKKNPAQAANADILSRETGVNFETVERNTQEVETENKWLKLDAKKILNETPTLGKHLSDPRNSSQAHDDIDNLSGIERGFFNNAARRVGERSTELAGQLTSFIDQSSKALEDKIPLGGFTVDDGSYFPRYVSSSELKKVFDDEGNAVAKVATGLKDTDFDAQHVHTWEAVKESFTDENTGALSATGDVLLFAAETGIASIPDMIAVLANLPAYILSRSSEIGEERAANKGQEQTIRETIEAAPFAVGSALLERIGAGGIINAGKEAVEEVGKDAIKTALKEVGKAGVKEGSTEFLQEGVIEYLGGRLGTDAEINVAEGAELGFAGMVAGGIYGSGMAGTSSATRGSYEFASNKLKASQADQKRQANLKKHADLSNLKKNNPEAFRELLNKMGNDTGSDTAYIDPVQAGALFQSGDVPQDVLENPTVQRIINDIPTALEEGRSIEIPVEDYATDIIGNEIENGLQPHTSFEPEALTSYQLNSPEFKEQIEEIRALDQEQLESEALVYNDQLGQLLSAGWERSTAEKYATVYEAFFRTLANRPGIKAQGLTPIDLYKQYNPKVGQEIDPLLKEQLTSVEELDIGLDRLRDGDIPTDKDARGQTALEFLLSKGGLSDKGGDLSNLDIDKGRVGRNRIVRENGLVFDDAIVALKEAGFINEENTGNEHELLINLLSNELAGESTYSPINQNDDLVGTQQGLSLLDEMLGKAGLDVNTMTNEEIRAALQEQVSEDVLNQATDTAAFKEWFGESKVVDENGEPLVVYHGGIGASDIEVFDAMYGGQTTGNNEYGAFHFTENQEVAEDYSRASFNRRFQDLDTPFDEMLEEGLINDKQHEEYNDRLNIDDEGQYELVEELAEQNLSSSSVYLSIENPIVIDMEGQQIDVGQIDELSAQLSRGEIPEEYIDQVIDIDREAIKDNREELEEKAREEFDLEPEEAIEDWQFEEVSREWAYENDYITETPIDGIIIKNMVDDIGEASKQVADQYIVFDPTRIKSVDNRGSFSTIDSNIYNQGQKNPRGYFDPNTNKITLTDNADLSTYLHESAHFFLNVMRDVAGSDESVQYDLNTLETWWQSQGAKNDVDRHEMFASGFETYLKEGKAPTQELQSLFTRFKQWLTLVYDRLLKSTPFGANNLDGVKLSDEVRDVMDRLLATEQEIKVARTSSGQDYNIPLHDLGLDEKQAAEHKKKIEEAHDEAHTELTSKVMAEHQREVQRWWKQGVKERADAIRDQLDNQPAYQARDELSNGDVKLNTHFIREVYGKRALSRMNRMTAKDGVNPDMLAPSFGYASGDEMVRDILGSTLNKKDRDTYIQKQAEDQMRSEYGDMLNDGTIAQEAETAVNNNKQAQLLALELRRLNEKLDKNYVLKGTVKDSLSVYRAAAEQTIADTPLNKIQPHIHLRNQQKHARESYRFAAQGKWAEAREAKHRQLRQFYLYKEAVKQQAESDRMIKNAADLVTNKNRRTRIGKAGISYIDQIDRFLSDYEFRKISVSKHEQMQAFVSWAQEREAEGQIVAVPSNIAQSAGKKHWKKLTVSELYALNDALKNIEHLSRLKNKLILGKNRREYQATKAEAIYRLGDLKQLPEASRTKTVEKKSIISDSLAALTEMGWLTRWLDGGKPSGFFHELIYQPITDVQREENIMLRQIAEPITKLIKSRSKQDQIRHMTKYWIPEIKDHLYGHQILSVALNTGSESSLRKMLLGEGFITKDQAENPANITIKNPKLQAILSKLQKSDWDLVQEILNKANELKDPLKKTYEAASGVKMEIVEALPIVTPFGTYPGGYYPMVYDKNRSTDAAIKGQQEKSTEQMLGENSFIKPSVSARSTNSRTENFADPVDFNLNNIYKHITETIHYITHYDTIASLNKVLNDREIIGAIDRTLGQDESKKMLGWLGDVARGYKPPEVNGITDYVLHRFKNGMTLGIMGFKLGTILIQPAGLFNSAQETGKRNMVRSFHHLFGNPKKTADHYRSMMEKSKVMPDRLKQTDREMAQAFKDIAEKMNSSSSLEILGDSDFAKEIRYIAKKNKMRALEVAQSSMMGIAYMQTYLVDALSWNAAYFKAQKQFESIDPKAREQKAVQYADWVVENIQGSGNVKNLNELMRKQSAGMQIFTMFMTFWSSAFQAQRDAVRKAKTNFKDAPATTAAAASGFVVMTMIIPVIYEMILKGDFGGDDEPADDALEVLTKSALIPTAGVPVIRDIVSGVFSDYGYSLAPPAQLIEYGIGSTKAALDPDKDLSKTQIEAMSKMMGAWFGVPGTYQFWNTYDSLYEAMEVGEDITLREMLITGPKQ